jgi:hypothetical protein
MLPGPNSSRCNIERDQPIASDTMAWSGQPLALPQQARARLSPGAEGGIELGDTMLYFLHACASGLAAISHRHTAAVRAPVR